MRNITEERQIYLCGEACPLFLFLSFPCFLFPMFISRSCHLYSYFVFLCGWRLVGAHVCGACVCVCLCICQHSVYFQSILFKDQTRGWWLIFLSLALSFISLGNDGGEERKRRGPPSTQAQEYRPHPLHTPCPLLFAVPQRSDYAPEVTHRNRLWLVYKAPAMVSSFLDFKSAASFTKTDTTDQMTFSLSAGTWLEPAASVKEHFKGLPVGAVGTAADTRWKR